MSLLSDIFGHSDTVDDILRGLREEAIWYGPVSVPIALTVGGEEGAMQPNWVGLEVWCDECQEWTKVHSQSLGPTAGTNMQWGLTLTCGHFDNAETVLSETRNQRRIQSGLG